MTKAEFLRAVIDSGFYEFFEDGRIYGLQRKKFLKPRVTKKGYIHAVLCMDGAQIAFYVHRIIWTAFRGDIPEGMQVNHINGKKDDNSLSNLELASAKENIGHAIRTGLREKVPKELDNRGEKHGMSRLTWDLVREIRRRHAAGETGYAIAKSIKVVSQVTIYRVINREAWIE